MVNGLLMIARSSAVPTRRRRPLPFDVLLAITVLLLALVVSGCDSSPLLAPTESTISLGASASRAPLNSEVEILATVQENSGTAVQNGTLVTFTTTLGTLQPREATTVRGVARTILQTGSTSGTATINATSGNARTTGGNTANNTTTAGTNVQILIGAAAASRISVVARPGAVSSSGGTAEIVAAVVDEAGNPVTGVAVSFSTDQGTLSASTATTDSNGEARTRLTTNRESIVTARVGAGGTDRTATVTVRVSAAPSLTVTIPATPPTVGVPFSFTVATAANTSLDVTVDFGDGRSQNLGRVSGEQTVAHTYTSAGTYTIRVTGRDPGTGESTTVTKAVTVGNRAPMNLTVTVSPNNPQVNTVVEFTAALGSGDTTQIANYEWEIRNSSGDLEFTTTTSGNRITRVFTTTGIRTVRVTADAVDGRSAVAEAQFVVRQ
jgi:adhesin/invasin